MKEEKATCITLYTISRMQNIHGNEMNFFFFFSEFLFFALIKPAHNKWSLSIICTDFDHRKCKDYKFF